MTKFQADRWGEIIACSCGNTPDGAGFVCCTIVGVRCEPTVGGIWAGHYRCNSCGHVAKAAK